MRKNKQQQQDEIAQRQRTIQDFNAFAQIIADDLGDQLDTGVMAQVSRANIAPPPEPIKDPRLNPDGIVDVVTFCEHPYFLNLRLTPWQKIILKLFYAGSQGNSHLKLDNERTDTCKGCVWETNCESEIKCCKAIMNKNDIIPKTFMMLENSPCIQCDRFSCEMRKAKYDYEKEMSLTEAAKGEIEVFETRSVGDLYVTETDLFERDLDARVKEQIRKKIGLQFSELILVLGRRSGKSFMVSVIALYEVYKFLMMKHPQSRFPLMEFDVITILNVAKAEEQAKAAIFDKIRNLAEGSPYFSKYIGKVTSLEIYFMTEHDMKENERRTKIGQEPLIGTIQLRSGHSNSSTMVGLTCAVIIIDEMAAMSKADTSEGGTDSDLYSMLKPSIATFGRQGKIICISNPLGPTGKFYELWEASFFDPTTLMFQLPTWITNPNIERAFIESEKLKDPANFEMHYGAQFGSTGTSPFFPKWAVEDAFQVRSSRRRNENGIPHVQYFAHLDPARSSDNYTLAIVHTEPIMGEKTADGKQLQMIVVDHIHMWRPRNGFPVNSEEVDSYIIDLSQKFGFAQISYDQWGSQASINKLRGYGLNVVEKVFGRHYQDLIFSELYELFIDGRIDIYNIDTQYYDPKTKIFVELQEIKEAHDQLLTLQKKWQKNGTFKIEALQGNHDDIPDCLAAASYEALKFKTYERLPRMRTVLTPRFR